MTPTTPGIRVMVVDDEALARSNVVALLRDDPGVRSIVECGSGLEALEQIKASKPDLLYLDVQMPECDGFDVIELLGEEVPPAVIFVTAYDEYALRAFEAGVLDYLLKPFDDTRFRRALERAKEKLGQLQSRRPAPERLMVKSVGRVSFVSIEHIDWIEADDYYARLHVDNTDHLLRRSLSDLETSLGSRGFCRIHRSALVNLARVARIEFDATGEYQVVLHSGAHLKLSRRCRKELEARLAGDVLAEKP